MPAKGWKKGTKTEQRKAARDEEAVATTTAAGAHGSVLDAVAAIINKKFGDGTFVLLIQPQPKSYANDEEMKAAISGQMDFRAKNRCEL